MRIAHIHVWDQKNKGDRGIVLAVQDLLRQAFPKVTIVDFPLETLKKIDAKTGRDLNACDLIVIGGGGIFYHWFMPFDAAGFSKLRRPIVIFGVGYIREVGARRLTKVELHSIASLCKQAKLVGVREFYTKRVLTKFDVPSSHIDVIGDPAVFLEEQPNAAISFSSKLNVGFNLNYSGWLGFGKYRKTILDAYAGVIQDFQKLGARMFYLQHHPGEQNIYPELKIPNLHVVNLPVKQQKWVYGKLDFVIGMMLHSVVMTFGAGTPFVCVGYDLRNKNFARFIHHPDLTIDVRQLRPTLLRQRVRSMFRQRIALKQELDQEKERIWKHHQHFLTKIKNLVENT